MEKIDDSARNKNNKTGTLRISDPALADCRSSFKARRIGTDVKDPRIGRLDTVECWLNHQ